MKPGTELIAEERRRQIEVEGWTANHDDLHQSDELAMAAVCYTLPSECRDEAYPDCNTYIDRFWPWDRKDWKPSHEDRIRELAKAGALIAAEIDRLQRKGQG